MRGKPESQPYVDLEHRSLHIAPGSVVSIMLATGGIALGIYGTTTYGRCVYGKEIGIYGYSNYGLAVYD